MKLCASCRRHVRESLCPFCGATDLLDTKASSRNTAGIARAKLIAGAATLVATAGVMTAEGCASGTGPGPDDAAVGDDATSVAVYGGPPLDGGPKDATTTDVINSVDAAYGGPPYDSGVAPPYGAPAYGAPGK